MAHKKGGGSSTNGRDSNAQRLGVKAFAGEVVTGGSIIARQRALARWPSGVIVMTGESWKVLLSWPFSRPDLPPVRL